MAVVEGVMRVFVDGRGGGRGEAEVVVEGVVEAEAEGCSRRGHGSRG